MEYFKDQDLVVMDLVDLDHCGFDHEDFDFELRLQGITDPMAKCPVALVVNFAGGHILTPDSKPETIAKRKQAEGAFHKLLAKLTDEPLVEVEVRGGMAEIVTKSPGVKVVLRDYDVYASEEEPVELEFESHGVIPEGKTQP
ncbi:MAG TPA: hypothetical protein ENN18_01585 [Proteobacteria bacterium]|nr:hypothetical protein [Pseudomonadota bacterium]